jgi:mono/diheme cytochrome c family protein
MAKNYLITFGVILVLAALVTAWAISKEGGESASPNNVSASEQEGKELFQTNCGACHTLAKAGTFGTTGPNLDRQVGSGPADTNKTRVLSAIENGINGRMPKGIVTGFEAEEVATFVAEVAGK